MLLNKILFLSFMFQVVTQSTVFFKVVKSRECQGKYAYSPSCRDLNDKINKKLINVFPKISYCCFKCERHSRAKVIFSVNKVV